MILLLLCRRFPYDIGRRDADPARSGTRRNGLFRPTLARPYNIPIRLAIPARHATIRRTESGVRPSRSAGKRIVEIRGLA